MRVLCVGNLYPPHHLGGYELVWQAAVEHLRGRGHALRVLASDHREPQVGAGEEADVHRELRWYWRDHAFPRIGLRARIELERENARTFARHVRAFEPDVVAWWAMGGMSLSLVERARRLDLPAVAFVNDDWLVYGPRVDAWLRLCSRLGVPRAPLERLTGLPARFDAAACGHVVFASEQVRTTALAEHALADVEVAHGGIPRLFLDPAPPRRWDWSLLYVGRIDPRKGIGTAIEALGLLPPEARLTVVGAGDDAHRRALGELAARLGVAARVEFAGRRERSALPAIYAAADAVVFPVRWAEPWGLVPLEALGCGRPVVATGTGGSAEYLRDGENCLLFAPGDAGSLAARLRRLAEDEPLRAALRAGGLATAAAHTDERFHARVEDVLDAACATGGAATAGTARGAADTIGAARSE